MTASDTHKEIGVVNGLEVVQPGPEVIHHIPGQYPIQYAAPGSYMTAAVPAPMAGPAPVPVQPQSTICGLRKVTFWLALAIAVLGAVIIAVAIGLGVGLSQRSNTKGAMAAAATSSPAAAGSTGSTTGSTSSTPTTPTASVTATTSLTSTQPSYASSSSVSASVCPSQNNTMVTIGSSSQEYQIVCDADFGGSGKKDLASTVFSSFDDCLGLCGSMNGFQSRSDVGATYNIEGTGGQSPGTCWCWATGGNDKSAQSNDGNVVAIPQ